MSKSINLSFTTAKPKITKLVKSPIQKITNVTSSILSELKTKNINLLESDSESASELDSESDSDIDFEFELEIQKAHENELKDKLELIDNPDHINKLGRFINKKVKTKRCKQKRIRKTIKDLNHEVVKYKDNKYVVCCIPFDDTYKMFIIDYDKKDDIIKKSWHFMSDGNYISHTYNTNEIKDKQLYLHNFVMDKLTFEGKGQQHTIDHINRIGTDNRKVNLRNLESQTSQNFNQKKRERITELPDDCDIDVNDIPKNIYYGKPNGLHGDFFYIELKGIPILCPDDKKYNWKTTKSKSVNLKIKLQQAINKLLELKNEYQELNDVIIDNISEGKREQLINEYNEILQLSHYPKDVINKNLAIFKSEAVNFNILNEDEKMEELDKIKQIKDLGKKKDNLPIDCGITIDMIPKYCYFKPETDKRGCKFIIERHPKLIENGERSWGTTEAKKVSIQEKFNSLVNRLKELE